MYNFQDNFVIIIRCCLLSVRWIKFKGSVSFYSHSGEVTLRLMQLLADFFKNKIHQNCKKKSF